MKSLRALIPFIVFVSLGTVYIYASPYISLFFLSRAIQQDNIKAIKSYLDVSPLRESLRSQVREYIEYSSKADGLNSGWTEFAKGIGGSLSEGCVVSATSADGIARVFRTGKLDLCNTSPADADPVNTGFKGAKLQYLSFDRFAVDFPSDSGSQLQGLELVRRNLFDWKISSASFDLTAIGESGASSAGSISCGKQIASIEQSIVSDERIPIANLQKRPIDSPFQGRSHEYSFILGGQNGYISYDSDGAKRINALLGESDKLQSFSRRVIESCSDIAVVSFGRYATGYALSWYFSNDGIFKGECLSWSRSDPRPVLRWGQRGCT